ncbi:hypothetical protein MLD38_007314 [Melastoma candidum]|uniref:Uncharacterized protein n=1 Tax=Melastoma candidum TaxID=119954 RepID=A0ACB9RQV6_9MYRT|nr:hypothetical protein MLD38_007314 [Melastoma candidum]
MSRSQSPESGDQGDVPLVREIHANGLSVKTAEVEAKLDEGNIQEAESSLREGLSLNVEEARALLGRLEYQRGKIEAALRVFESIDLQAAIDCLQPSTSDKAPSRKSRSRTDSLSAVSQQAASLVLEAIYLKAKSLQKLGRSHEAANECKTIVDAAERIFYQGILDVQVDPKLQETVGRAVELLPELWKQSGCYTEAIASYRRSLLGQWNLDSEGCARIQQAFAAFLLYCGVEAGPPSLAAQIEGSFIPKNNLEEAILLLVILIRKFNLGIVKWDPSVMEHLTFALSLCSQTPVLAKQCEEIMPGVYHRIDRWNRMALCYTAAGQSNTALNLLRKSLHRHERPDDPTALLLASKICSDDSFVAAEGVEFARRAVDIAQAENEHLKGVALRMLGLCLARQAKVSPSDSERSRLQSEALKSLEAALALEPHNSDLMFELGVQYAEQRNLSAALRSAEQFIDKTGGSVMKGWRLLALILSAQQRFSEAGVVTEAALDATAKWEQAPILRLKAKMKISQSLPLEAIETYRYLLALVQAQRKTFGPVRSVAQAEDDKDNEFEVWHGLASVYSGLSLWKDAEICLAKARESKQFSVEALRAEGIMLERRGEILEALVAYTDALLLEPSYVPCKVLIGAILQKMGRSSLPVARGLLSDALRIDPTNVMAWYHLGLVHKDDGRLADAADCFQAASMLEESDPVESFGTIV